MSNCITKRQIGLQPLNTRGGGVKIDVDGINGLRVIELEASASGPGWIMPKRAHRAREEEELWYRSTMACSSPLG